MSISDGWECITSIPSPTERVEYFGFNESRKTNATGFSGIVRASIFGQIELINKIDGWTLVDQMGHLGTKNFVKTMVVQDSYGDRVQIKYWCTSVENFATFELWFNDAHVCLDIVKKSAEDEAVRNLFRGFT